MDHVFKVDQIINSDIVQGIFDTSIKFAEPSKENAHLFLLGNFYTELCDWKFPIGFAFSYYFIVSVWKQFIKKDKKPEKSGFIFKMFVLAHNIFLCLFSAACFLNVMPRIIQNFSTRPLKEAYCDLDGSFWSSGIGYWTWLFYLSKYYEVIDTLILLLKGRAPSFLQSYHHTGAILALWLGARSGANSIWVFVAYNSFIHTIMYFYYSLATMGYQPFWKRYLTSLQIIQFLLAGTMGISYMFIPNCARLLSGAEYTLVDYLSHAFVVVYLVPLTILFVDFAKKSYYTKPDKKVLAGQSNAIVGATKTKAPKKSTKKTN